MRRLELLWLLGFLSPAIGFADTISTAASGPWSDPATWSAGRLPAAGDDVRILAGHVIRYDLNGSDVFASVLINGALIFATDTDTQLDASLIVLAADPQFDLAEACTRMTHAQAAGPRPLLQVGAPGDPVAGTSRAIIRLHDTGGDPDCAPGIISHGGRLDLHGAPVTPTWTKLAATAAVGTDTLNLADPVNWSPGDRIIVVGTLRPGPRGKFDSILGGEFVPETEVALVTAVAADGLTLVLDRQLAYEHLGGPAAEDLRGEVANLSRNVIVESADPAGVRGHTMFHQESAGAISYAEFRHLGKAGRLGRYPIHFHLVKDSMRGSYVQGASIWDSANRWLTIHGSEFIVVRDTVGYGSLGHGFFLENGSEVYNLLGHNLGVQAYITDPLPGQSLAYDLNHGGCYWAANARNFLDDNVFAECDNDDSFILDYAPGADPMPTLMLQPDGSRASVDVRTVSGGLIRGLEVHSTWGWGPWIRGGRYPETDPLTFLQTRVWNTSLSIDISGDNVVFDGVEVFNSSYGFYNEFPGPHLVRNAYFSNVSPNGTMMAYRGGHGTMLYEDISIESSVLVFRMTAKNEIGTAGQPIIFHARNVNVLNPSFRNKGGSQRTAWVGTEDANVRVSPLLMLVNHDAFGPGLDGIFLPAVQSEQQEGVPAGLTFSDAAGVQDANGVLLEGRGDVKYAAAALDWPDSPLQAPVDTLPPATSILSPQPGAFIRSDDGTLEVCGVAVDQSPVAAVTVNEAVAGISANGLDWCAVLDDVPEGELAITAMAVDTVGNAELYPHSVNVTVQRNHAPELLNPGDQLGAVGVLSALQLEAMDSDGDAVVFAADGLPPGFALDAGIGLITGMPGSSGEYAVTVSADDGHGAAAEASFDWLIYSALAITTTSLPSASRNNAYTPYQLDASGGIGPYQWTVTDGSLPSSMSLDSNGVLSGTPLVAGLYDFVVEVTDANGSVASQTLYLSVTRPSCAVCHL